MNGKISKLMRKTIKKLHSEGTVKNPELSLKVLKSEYLKKTPEERKEFLDSLLKFPNYAFKGKI